MSTTKVSLRKRAISGGRLSLYLDFYPAIRIPESMQMTRREYLRIYINQKPTTEIQREFNNEMLKKAEAIRSIRVHSLINEEFGFLDKSKKNADFLAYFYNVAMTKDQKWLKIYIHFENFVAAKCTFGDVTIELCRRFREYLIKGKQLKNNKLNLSQNSAASYFSTFRALLKKAYIDKLLRENINDFLEKIEYQDVKIEFLTLDELKRLAKTPCENELLKSASLFACMTGLRISDVLKLKWSEIVLSSEGGYCLRFETKKTGAEITLPISEETLQLCGERKVETVFKGLKYSMTRSPLKRWIKEAQIEKNITFHCFRHTFATLQIASGTSIYTVSKMLGHKNISTTQIYADVVNDLKRDSASKISLV